MPALKLLLAAALGMAALAARAELYRWIDPQTGSVKFSSVPPPWFGDAEREAVSPKVEVISIKPPPASTPDKPAAVAPKPKPAAPQAAEPQKPPPPPVTPQGPSR